MSKSRKEPKSASKGKGSTPVVPPGHLHINITQNGHASNADIARNISALINGRDRHVSSYRAVDPNDRCNCGDGAMSRGCVPGAPACVEQCPMLHHPLTVCPSCDNDVVSAEIVCGEPVGAFGDCALEADHAGMHNPHADRRVR